MNEIIGYALATLICFGSDYNCEVKAAGNDTQVYASKFDCEWAKEALRPSDIPLNGKVECVEVRRQR